MTNEACGLLTVISATVAMAVLARFFWGWIFNRPEVIRDALPFIGGQRRSKRSVDLNGRRIKLIHGELRDELLSRPYGMRGDFVVMAGRLCAFDDGRDVYYGRWNMIRTASAMDIANWEFFMCCGLSIALACYFPVEHLGLLARTDSLVLNKLMEALFFAPWVLFGWLALRRVRSVVLLNRVEKVVREMRHRKGLSLTDYHLGEMLFRTNNLWLFFCLLLFVPYIILVPFFFLLEKFGVF